MMMKKIFILFGLIVFISCSKEVEERQALQFDLPKKEMELDKLIAYSTTLEQQNHEKFIENFEAEKEKYFEEKIEGFLDSYDSFGLINVLKRKWFRSDEANKTEIETHLKLIFNPIDYQRFEEKQVNDYLSTLKKNREQFEVFQGNEANGQWRANISKFHFYDNFTENISANLEGSFKEQILLYALESIDWILLVLFVLSIIGGASVFFIGLPWEIEVVLLVLTFVFSYVFENKRENKIAENIMNTIKEEIISKPNEVLLKQLNTNTKNYYYGENQ